MLPDPTSTEFPAALKKARNAAHLSQADLAARAGISPVMPARYENANGPTVPSHATWAKLNSVLFPNSAPAQVREASGLAAYSSDQLIAELKRRGAQSVTIVW